MHYIWCSKTLQGTTGSVYTNAALGYGGDRTLPVDWSLSGRAIGWPGSGPVQALCHRRANIKPHCLRGLQRVLAAKAAWILDRVDGCQHYSRRCFVSV